MHIGLTMGLAPRKLLKIRGSTTVQVLDDLDLSESFATTARVHLSFQSATSLRHFRNEKILPWYYPFGPSQTTTQSNQLKHGESTAPR